MAFCPNCGTPNTDQAEKCVSCGFELAPKQKAKFKGTIMMSGVQAPTAPGQPAAAPPQAAPPAPQPAAPAVFTPASHQPLQGQAPAPAKNLGFEKTMMGQVGPPPGAAAPQPAPHAPAPPAPAFAADPHDLGRAATVEQPAPNFQQPPAAYQPPAQIAQPNYQPPAAAAYQPPAAAAPAPAANPGFGSQTGGIGGGGGGGFDNTGDMPAPPKSSTGKMIAIGCAAILVLACVVSGVLMVVKGKQFFSMAEKLQSEGPTLEWRTRVAQALENVLEICKTDCQGAAVYFHPQLKDELMGQAKGLSQDGLLKLVDPTQSEARMLDGTDDSGVAKKLNLDPQECVRIMSGSAKVIGCSVLDATTQQKSLRIVMLEGIASL